MAVLACLLPVATASSSLRPGGKQPCVCSHAAAASMQGSYSSSPVQQHVALRHARALSRHSAFMGSRLALTPGRQAGTSQHGGGRGQLQVLASFFGVGAPEAVLVGLVALVIFGPQGLAEAAKTAGKTIKAFKPTIDELSTVSRDLRSTLDEELGINEIRKEFRGYTSPTAGSGKQPDWDNLGTTPVKSSAASSQDAAAADPDIEAKRAQSAQLAWGSSEAKQQQVGAAGGSDAQLSDVTLDEIQAELARRRAARKDTA